MLLRCPRGGAKREKKKVTSEVVARENRSPGTGQRQRIVRFMLIKKSSAVLGPQALA